MSTSLVWFTNNLRTNDNETLSRATKFDKVIAVYCFDPRHFEEGDFGFIKTGKYRTKFLIESVQNLRTKLKDLNISLLVFCGKPENCIPKVVNDHQIDTIFYQEEWTRDEVRVINSVKNRLDHQVNMVGVYDQFLFHPDDIPIDAFHQIPNVFTSFRKKCEKYAEIRKSLPKLEKKQENNLFPNNTLIPTLKELGHNEFRVDGRSVFPFQGGEEAALHRLQSYFWDTQKLSQYKKTRNGLIGIDYSSKFSPWLANGSISARTIYEEVRKYEKQIKKNQDTYWLVFELIWRDYFKYVSLKHGNKIFHLRGILDKTYHWKNDTETLNSWIKGSTDQSFVNANMKELALTGWMSNRGRQNVGSYWSKHLEQDWRIGAAYFESMLIDYDVHSNWGNWMYVSGVGNDPRDRKFNINRQADLYDPNGEYQATWLKSSNS